MRCVVTLIVTIVLPVSSGCACVVRLFTYECMFVYAVYTCVVVPQLFVMTVFCVASFGES